MSLVLNDNLVLTDLAYEKAKRLGMSLVSASITTPPAAPVRPYLSQQDQIGERVKADGMTTPPPVRKGSDPHSDPTNGLLQTHPDPGTDPVQLRQQLQAQMAGKFPDMDKTLLGEIIERVIASLWDWLNGHSGDFQGVSCFSQDERVNPFQL